MTYARIAFDIPGDPFGKQSPRSTRAGRTYTPKPTVDYMNTVRAIALQHFPRPFVGPVRITIRAVVSVPPSWSAKKRSEHVWRWCEKKPDMSNIFKGIEDALNRIAYEDDRQIVEYGPSAKTWGERGNVVVVVEALTEQPCSP
jgi:Holliday junction resolvase RusA-like endonuclease